MWTRTLLGIVVGLLLSWSVGLNAVLLAPWSRPTGLAVGYIGGFFLLAGYLTWVYCAPELRPVMRWSLPVLAVTAGLNAWVLSGGVP